MSSVFHAPLFRYLLRQHRVSCVLCTIPPIFVGVAIGVLLPTYEARQAILNTMSGFIQNFFGEDAMSGFQLETFFTTIPFNHPLTLAAMAAVCALPALAVPAGERGRGGLDLILSTALERKPMVSTVYLFTLLAALPVCLAPWCGSVLGALQSGTLHELDSSRMMRVAAAAMVLCSALAACALMVSVLAPNRGSASRRYLACAGGFWMLDFLAQAAELPWLGWWTPFGHYQPARILSGTAPWWPQAVVLGLAIALALVARRQEDRATMA